MQEIAFFFANKKEIAIIEEIIFPVWEELLWELKIPDPASASIPRIREKSNIRDTERSKSGERVYKA